MQTFSVDVFDRRNKNKGRNIVLAVNPAKRQFAGSVYSDDGPRPKLTETLRAQLEKTAMGRLEKCPLAFTFDFKDAAWRIHEKGKGTRKIKTSLVFMEKDGTTVLSEDAIQEKLKTDTCWDTTEGKYQLSRQLSKLVLLEHDDGRPTVKIKGTRRAKGN